jgi:hypothetical protein
MNPQSSSGSGRPLQTGVVVVVVVPVTVVVLLVVVVVVLTVLVVLVVVVVSVVPVTVVVVVVVVVIVVVVVVVVEVAVTVVVVDIEVVVDVMEVVVKLTVVVVVVAVVDELVQTPHFAGQSARRFAPVRPLSPHRISGTTVHDFGSWIKLHVGRVVVAHTPHVAGHLAFQVSPHICPSTTSDVERHHFTTAGPPQASGSRMPLHESWPCDVVKEEPHVGETSEVHFQYGTKLLPPPPLAQFLWSEGRLLLCVVCVGVGVRV